MLDVDDLGRPALAPIAAFALVERLVQPHRCHRTVAGWVVDQQLSEQHDSVVHGVPVTGEIVGDLRHRPTVLADLACRPSCCARRQRGPLRRDRRVVLAPGQHHTRHVRATPPLLAPRQPGRAAERWQINQQHFALAVVPRRSPAPTTVRSRRARLDLDTQPRRPLANAADDHVGQANKQRAHARRIGFQQGLLDTGRRKTPSALQSPCPTPGTYSTLRSEAPDCVVRVQLRGGGIHLLFIEVKLSEDTFSTCSAFASANNPRKHICASPGPFGGNTRECFQLCNHDREHRRRYDVALDLSPTPANGFGCSFRDGTNQVMRNVALARAVIQRGDAVSASMMLMAPDDHTAIWEQWHRHIATLTGVNGIRFAALPASQIAPLHEPDTARALSQRYLLPPRLVELRLAQHHADQRFPNGVALCRLYPDGSLNYLQPIERLIVTETTAEHVYVQTPYPAGPFIHEVPVDQWLQTGNLTIRDPEHGSRILSPDLSTLSEISQHELPALAAAERAYAPWWTAPVQTSSDW